jgi:NADPH:quinone reductase
LDTVRRGHQRPIEMGCAIRLTEFGGPEVLRVEHSDPGHPGPNEVRLRQTAIGVNFIDVVQRRGVSPIALTLPSGIGGEAAGIIEAVGSEVRGVSVGDRVAYANIYGGAYASIRLVKPETLVPLPDEISDRQAAGMMLKGLTAWCLVRQVFDAKAGDVVLIHAAAGGVGSIVCQWLKHLGATVIGTVSSYEKADVARSFGCDHAIVYTKSDFVSQVMDITGGKKVSAVFDSVGKETFVRSLDCIRPRGLAVLFGQASGPVGPIDLGLLAAKGALFATRPTLTAYTSTRSELLNGAGSLFKMVKSGCIRIPIIQTYHLTEAAKAHHDLEARRTVGCTILLP